MADINLNQSDLQPCEVCSAIPDEMWANTGRGDSLYPELGRLVRLDLNRSDDIYECPGCGALFEWEDLPQYYGSGNCDEERLTRLNPAQYQIVRALLDAKAGDQDAELFLEHALQNLSRDLVYTLLRYQATYHKQAFSKFLEPLVVRLMAQSDGGLFDVIRSYCDCDREQLAEVVRLLDAGGPNISKSAQYMRETFMEQMQKR